MLLSILLLAFQGSSAALETRAGLEGRILGVLREYVADGRPPAVSAGVVTPSTTKAVTAGLADRARKESATNASRFCAGSTGKTFVAATVLQLVQEGKLR